MSPEDGKKNREEIVCRLCAGRCRFVFPLLLRRKYRVSLYLCRSCGLLQTEAPYWLAEAYSAPASALDTGVLRRNLIFMRIVAVLLRFWGDPKGVYLDYGGGHGIFTRLMRDHGYDFWWQDLYAENLYARGFEYEEGMKPIGVTAFEVLEHLENPEAFFSMHLGRLRPRILMASTRLFVEPVSPDWDYFYPEDGQHIAFYQEKTLRWVANKYGYRYAGWRYFHVFSTIPLPQVLVRSLIPLSFLLYPLLPFASLHLEDHRRISSRQDGAS